MAQSILIFDFGTNEEAAQQARHKVDGWKQAFRLGDKMLLKFEREEPVAGAEKDGEQAAAAEGVEPPKSAAKASDKAKGSNKKAPAKATAKAGSEEEKTEPPAHVRVFVRLAFSDHEKLSYQRWLDRIPTEEPFKSVQGETVRSGQSEFEKASEQFEALD